MRPYYSQILTRRHRRERVNWLQHGRWTRIRSCFLMIFWLNRSDRRTRFYRRRGERFADTCATEVDPFRGSSVMV